MASTEGWAVLTGWCGLLGRNKQNRANDVPFSPVAGGERDFMKNTRTLRIDTINGGKGSIDYTRERVIAMPISIQGTVKADGTLELDGKVSLPAGRVQVAVQPLAPPERRSLLETREPIRAPQPARG